MGRVAIFGDIGGHREELYAELVRLGADAETLRLPDDLSVIQVGDLIHRGPDSPGVLALVARVLAQQPAQWRQLSGNHEAQYLMRPRFGWHEHLGNEDRDLLRSWWANGQMRVAASCVSGDGEQMLVTHAGLTANLWWNLGSPATAVDAAAALNALMPDQPRLYRAGAMLGEHPTFMAGPWWAEAGTELYPSWQLHITEEGEPMPFSQAHGHSTAFFFDRHRWAPLAQVVRERVRVDDVDRHVTFTTPGGRIVGVDPGHGQRPARRWRPLLLEDAALTS